VLDTDVASRIFRGQPLDADEREALTTDTPVLSFVTIAEWAKWAHKRNWGAPLPLLTRNRKDFGPLIRHGLRPL
jgi:predicted nucleic acid-binding protein